jgi:LacI family transcriptional regulator
MATLKQVAERAGVTLSTASFVLNDNPRVAPETRELVLKAVRELKYTLGKKGRPRRASGDPVTPRRRNLIAFLLPFSQEEFRTNITYLTAVQAAEAALNKSGRGLVIRTMEQTTAAGLERLQSTVDGLLTILTEPEHYPEIVTRIPSVRLMGPPAPSLLWDHVTYDAQAVGGLAAKYVLGRGHRACAFFAPFPDHPNYVSYHQRVLERQVGFAEAVAAAGGTTRVNTRGLRTWLANDPDRMREILAELLLTEPRPTALFVPGDHFMITVYGALFSLGVAPGRDVDIVSCNNDLSLLDGLHPRPGVVDIHIPCIGMMGVKMLLERLENPEMPKSVRAFQPGIVPSPQPWPTPKNQPL